MNISAEDLSMANSNVASPSYGISEWPDTEDLYQRFAELLRRPIRPIRRENMEVVLGYFNEKCAVSQRLSDEASRIIPGGIQHNLAF